MEGLISIIVILYLVASVVGAVLKRIQQGPIVDEPTIPTGSGRQQHGQPQDSSPREVVVLGLPPFPSESQQPTIGEGQLVEVWEEADEPEPDLAEASSEGVAEERELVTIESWSTFEGKRDEDYLHYDDRPVQKADRQEVRAKSPYSVATASEWRRAVVLAEVLGKPRGLDPFRPPGR